MSRKTVYKYEIAGTSTLDASNLIKETERTKTALAGIKLPQDKGQVFLRQIENVEERVEKLQKLMKEGFSSPAEQTATIEELRTLPKTLQDIEERILKINKNKITVAASSETGKTLEQMAKMLKIADDNAKIFAKNFKDNMKELDTAGGKVEFNVDVDQVTTLIEQGKSLQQLFGIFGNLDKKQKNLGFIESEGKIISVTEAIKKEREEVEKLKDALEKALTARLAARSQAGGTESEGYRQASQDVKITEAQIKAKKNLIKQYENQEKAYEKNIEPLKKMKANAKELIDVFKDLGLEGFNTENVEQLKLAFLDLNENIAPEEAERKFEALLAQLSRLNDEARKVGVFGEMMKENAEKTEAFTQSAARLEGKIKSFFGFAAALNLVRKAIRQAYAVVKELDAAMTDIAVVTDKTLGDIWQMRGAYSAMATELGAKTIDMVNASKLYIQQGLRESEVNKVATETIKMARIARLDGAEATNLMTAALRGFNLEMESAQTVNDVYSQLAAKSAADTEEIAQAMLRTAAIAHSAGASFENTAVFLTHMINFSPLLQ